MVDTLYHSIAATDHMDGLLLKMHQKQPNHSQEALSVGIMIQDQYSIP